MTTSFVPLPSASLGLSQLYRPTCTVEAESESGDEIQGYRVFNRNAVTYEVEADLSRFRLDCT
eukprot:364678-Chlamydomonas_euryale.AAC.3